MNVPGIRHTKDCVKRKKLLVEEPASSGLPEDEVPMIDQNDDQKPSEPDGLPVGHDLAHVPHMEVDGPEYMDTEVAMTSRNMKRESDVPLENLEDEIRRETETDRQKMSHVLSSMVSAAFGVSDYVPLSDMLVDSVQFAAESDFAVMTFGSQKIKIWKPSSAVDNSDMSELPGDQTHDGMIKEVGNLGDMEAGDLMTLEGVEKLKREKCEVNFRTIGCRWVTTRKTVDTVRSRIVVKDVAEKNRPSARSLGISSPTPSSDAMFLLLAVAGCRDYAIGSADIAHAFMATPLRVRDVIIKLPLSGLNSCSLEPCLFTGVLPSGPCGMLCYVDDLLLITPKEEDINLVFDQIGKSVTLKKTGLVGTSLKGGNLRFLGRVIFRQLGESSVQVSLPSDYLDSTFAAYNLKEKVGSNSPPDLGSYVEKTDGTPLSPESYQRFRSALGKVAWLSQTRQDLRAYISILACQQSSPTNHTEAGLRALLRFLMQDRNVAVCLQMDRL